VGDERAVVVDRQDDGALGSVAGNDLGAAGVGLFNDLAEPGFGLLELPDHGFTYFN
jgi:hypothetical protein